MRFTKDNSWTSLYLTAEDSDKIFRSRDIIHVYRQYLNARGLYDQLSTLPLRQEVQEWFEEQGLTFLGKEHYYWNWRVLVDKDNKNFTVHCTFQIRDPNVALMFKIQWF